MDKLKTDLIDLFDDGVQSVHVLTDFDGTLTRDYVDGKKTPSLISVLRDQPGYLSPEYQERAHLLYNTYSPLENDLGVDLAIRKAKMVEWWSRHEELLIESGLQNEHLEKLASTEFIQWRAGAKDFLMTMDKMGVPLVVLSASGIGEVLPLFCQKQGVKLPNMDFIINRFIWDDQGRAVQFHQPIIHSLNKDETAVRSYEQIFEKVKERVNVLLLGNSLGDLGMVEGFKAKKILKIGFLDKEEVKKVASFEKAYDYVIVEDGFQKINDVLKEI